MVWYCQLRARPKNKPFVHSRQAGLELLSRSRAATRMRQSRIHNTKPTCLIPLPFQTVKSMGLSLPYTLFILPRHLSVSFYTVSSTCSVIPPDPSLD